MPPARPVRRPLARWPGIAASAAPGARGGRPAAWAVMALLLAACAFTPPPPLPEELAAQQEEEERRRKRVNAGQAEDPDAAGDQAEGGGQAPTFQKGDEPALGMSPEEMKAYATAQGDPAGGEFTLEQALHGLPGDGTLVARFLLEDGRVMQCELFEGETPTTVANFVGLARGFRPTLDAQSDEWKKVRYYDGTGFHRVIPGFMIQGGDPTGTGRGNAGYVIPDEFRSSLRHDAAGMLSMANRGPGTGSAQFFITLGPAGHLDGKHTIFGKCDEQAIEVAEAIAATAGPGDQPTTPQTIDTIEITRVTPGARIPKSLVAPPKATEPKPKATEPKPKAGKPKPEAGKPKPSKPKPKAGEPKPEAGAPKPKPKPKPPESDDPGTPDE